ncbi:hypothetical protein NPIL_628931 [Nephila pilipes]|uniref:Zinc finger RING-type eukaryotic domain-containing protein n=1 Tax=Nephila pilipes TaxID=299642 RepID=A0A8X6QME5_NEPPI|nr:hypothetical protein NPIL_628931 [Nephila pilipes]
MERDDLLIKNARLRRALRSLAQVISDITTPHQCIGGFVLDVARRPESPVQPALPRWEDETIGHISLVLLLRTRCRKRSSGGNVGRRRSREICTSPLDPAHEARLVPKSRRSLASEWTTGFESMADSGTNGDELFEQCSLAYALFGESEARPICLLVMHRPVKTHCGHVFHEKCLKRGGITNPTSPFYRQLSIV